MPSHTATIGGTRRLVAISALAVLAIAVLAGCGGGSGHKASSSPVGTRLTADDVPDVLMPDVWPGTGVRAYRNGNDITIYTNFDPSGTTIGGRSTHVAAEGMCNAALGDLGFDMSLSIEVYAGNGTELVSKRKGEGCRQD